MNAPFDLDALEAEILATPITGRLHFNAMPLGEDLPETATAPTSGALISEADFLTQFIGLHDMAGGMVQMRTGAPCPLGDQARSEGGKLASDALYKLIASNPALSRLVLGSASTFWGQMAAIGMHGFTCVQMVRVSINNRPVAVQPEVFEDETDSET